MRNLYRDKSAVVGRMVITSVMSGVGGLIFFQVGQSHDRDGATNSIYRYTSCESC